MIGRAYIGEEGVTGGPDWVRSGRFAFGIGSITDKTKLLEPYDFELMFAMEPGMQAPKKEGIPEVVPGSGPSVFTAVQEQLGLRLVSQKVSVEYLIIESVERPSAN